MHRLPTPKSISKPLLHLKPPYPQQSIRSLSHKPNPKKAPKNETQQQEDQQVYTRHTIYNIYKILKYSTWDSAKDQLETLPIKWDSFTVNSVLKTHPPLQKSWLFFNWVSKFRSFKHDHFTYTTMLHLFGEAGRVSSMENLFRQMVASDIKVDDVTYTCLMHWVWSSGDVDRAVRIWEGMRSEGWCGNVVSYTAYLKILLESGRVEEGVRVYREMIESGCKPNCYTYTVLMEHLVGCGKYEEALDIFSKMQEAGVLPDKATCNILIEKCCKAGETGTIMKILLFMKEHKFILRYPVFLEALETLHKAGKSDELLRQVHPHISVECLNKERTDRYTVVFSDSCSTDFGILLILLKKQSLVAIDHLISEAANKNVELDAVALSKIVEVNCDRFRINGALLAFEYGMKMGIDVGRNAFLALVGSLIRSGDFQKVVDIVKKMIGVGHSLNSYQAALLIYRLGIARKTNDAAKIFNLLSDELKNVASYTALMSVYFTAGSPDKALEIYKTMRGKEVCPSLGTYDILLAGLGKNGRNSGAETYRKEKKEWLIGSRHKNDVLLEEKICELLFAQDAIS